jgi:acyl-CoA reductase-like NAD-dependent aldehyde dehydrogenase
VSGAGLVRSVSPQRPQDVVTEVAAASADDVAKAAARARSAQRGWRDAVSPVRASALAAAAGALRARAGEAAALIVREVGKPAVEATGEVARAVAILDYYAQASYAPLGATLPPSMPGLLYTERRPHGVAGLVTPWNFPLAIPLWKAAPALAAGNGVLLKPSPDATAAAIWLAELLAGVLPDGLFQVLPGAAETGRAVLDAADVVSFTGSAAVGRQVTAATAGRGVPVQAEMGGQNAAIVLNDADPQVAAAQIAAAAMGFAGQKCTATRRVIVIGGLPRLAEVTEALVAAVRALEPGDPASAGVLVGPVIGPAARAKVLDAANAVTSAGGRLLHGGSSPDLDGWFVTPTLVSGIDADHPVAQEETFGPLAVVQPAGSLDAALRLAEGVRYGLVTSVHGRDLTQVLAAVHGVQTGLIKVNAPTTGVDFWAPFGGERDSSYGQREQGSAALDFYASTRTITLAPHP